MRIGIMGAMPEEVDSIRAQMLDVSMTEHGGRQYHLGQLNGIEVVLAFSRWGKVAASATATSLITEFEIDQLIFTGVAGAVSPDLNIGDVVIGEQFYQHDMDARPLFNKHVIPLTGITFFKADASLIKRAEAACKNLEDSIPAESLMEFRIKKPKYIIGCIASGDQFIADAKKTQSILSDQPKTVAVEMEGAAVAQVCHDYKIPFVVIRTISDLANHSAQIDFPKFINQIAKHYSENIVKKMLSESFADDQKSMAKNRKRTGVRIHESLSPKVPAEPQKAEQNSMCTIL